MTAGDALNVLADRFGILPGYHDLSGAERRTSPDTQKALLRANGLSVGTEALIHETLAAVTARDGERSLPVEVIATSGAECALGFGAGAEWHLADDGQGAVLAEGRGTDGIVLPPLPSGVYDLTVKTRERRETVAVLVAPSRLPKVGPGMRLWGLNAALYGLRSGRNAGLGDFEDLARLCGIAARFGADFVGINPLHAMGIADREAISPYSPSHRGFFNIFHIALEQIAGVGNIAKADDMLSAAGPEFTRLRSAVMVQYGAQKTAHVQALETLFHGFCSDADPVVLSAFQSWAYGQGAELGRFARYESVSEQYGPDWRRWPADVQRCERADMSPAPDPLAGRSQFHSWLQWVADGQVAAAQARSKAGGMALGLYLDLAVGARRGGAESWCEADTIADGVSIGAPPDHLSPEGQNWNLAAFAPHKLRMRKYAALRRIIARSMQHAGILRIDHVLGLNRSFWIPDDGSPGGYVRQPFAALVAIIKIEAERAGTVIVGEDLGLVPDGFRETMRKEGFFGYSVLQYEKDGSGRFRNPTDYDAQILACFGTHDTPTLAGFRDGRDIDWWRRLGWIDDAAAARNRDARQADVTALLALASRQENTQTKRTDRDALSDSVHSALAASPAALVSVQLDDALGQVEAQNLPGTIDEHPNWRRKYEVTLDDLKAHPALNTVSKIMRDRGRFSQPADPKEV